MVGLGGTKTAGEAPRPESEWPLTPRAPPTAPPPPVVSRRKLGEVSGDMGTRIMPLEIFKVKLLGLISPLSLVKYK